VGVGFLYEFCCYCCMFNRFFGRGKCGVRKESNNKLVSGFGGQGTIEYLIIIAIVIVIALVVVSLMTGFLSPASGVGQSINKVGNWSNTIALTESSVNPDGNYLVRLANMSGEEFTVTNVAIGGTDANYSEDLFMGNAKNFVIDSSEVCSTGDSVSKDVVVTYVSRNGLIKKEVYPAKVFFMCENYNVSLLANQCSTFGGSQSLSADSFSMVAGVYSAVDLNSVDVNLNAQNIWRKTIFGVTGVWGVHSGLTKCTAWNGSTWINATTCSDVNVPANQDAALDSARGMFDTSGRFVAGTFVDGNKYVRDTWNDLMWWDSHSASTMDWNAAMSYCNNFSANGYSNWRLATVAEAYQSFDYGAASNGGSYACAKGFTDCFGNWVWTSSSLSWSPTAAYRYLPTAGPISYSNKTGSSYARCVRSEN